MFFTENLPSACPSMMHPQCYQSQSNFPFGSFIPMRMRAMQPEMTQQSCHKRRAAPHEELLSNLSKLLSTPDSEEAGDSSSDSDGQEFMDFLTMFGYPMRHKKNKCSKKSSTEKTAKTDQSKKPDSASTDSKTNDSSKDEVKSAKELETKCDNVIGSPLDMRGYDPKYISVKTNEADRIVTVTAKRVHHTLFGPYVSERKQVFPIPEGIETRDIRSFLSPDGVFYLTASKTQQEPDTDKSESASAQTQSKPEDEAVSAEDDSYAAQSNEHKTDQTENENEPTLNESISGDAEATVAMETNNDEANTDDSVTDESPEIDEVSDEIAAEIEAIDNTEPEVDAAETNDEKNETYDVIISQFNMRGFDADEIKMDIHEKAGTIEISATHEENTPNGVIIREYYRTVPIPEGVPFDEIRSHLSPEGEYFIQGPSCTFALTA